MDKKIKTFYIKTINSELFLYNNKNFIKSRDE